MNTDILATMRVRCPICKAAPGKVCKGYDTWERTRDGPLHEKRHEKAPDPIGSDQKCAKCGKAIVRRPSTGRWTHQDHSPTYPGEHRCRWPTPVSNLEDANR